MKNIKGAIEHLRNHQAYPASRDQLIAECNNLSDFSNEDKKWFMDNLPHGVYKSPDEVVKALQLMPMP